MRVDYLTWADPSGEHRARWLSPSSPPPARAAPADDRTTAAGALARALRGEGVLYRGDYRNARQLLSAMGRRLAGRGIPRGAPLDRYLAERRKRAREHEVLSRLVVPIGGELEVALPRAPDVREALAEALGPPPGEPGALPLRDLLGMIGAHEWRRRGVRVDALQATLRPHYGVFAPVRAEHVDLVAGAVRAGEPGARPLEGKTALDVGTGTGVLAFVLARAGARVVATDSEARAVACARENAVALGLAGQVRVVQADLFPPDGAARFDLVVCNPPWLPGAAVSPLERAVYDPGGTFLARLVAGLPARLGPGGEALVVLSDLAERIGLRREGVLQGLARQAGLRAEVIAEARPGHPRARDEHDPLHDVRSGERTVLWRLWGG
jgi:methylase of polypeptide subunit release factors